MSAPEHLTNQDTDPDPDQETDPEARSGWRTVGFVGAACVACCIGPLLAVVGGLGAIGSVATFLAWPAAGLAAAAATVAALVLLRRRRAQRCDPAAKSVPVELDARRQTDGPSTEDRP